MTDFELMTVMASMTVGRGIIDERLNPQITKDLGKPPSASISKSTINPNTQKGSIFVRLCYLAQNLDSIRHRRVLLGGGISLCRNEGQCNMMYNRQKKR